MVDIIALEKQAHLTTDESGEPVIQLPLETWNSLGSRNQR